MATPSPYRSLSSDRRVALVTHVITATREGRALYIQRLAARSGFRAVTLQSWSADRLAREIVRMKAETPNDELDLLHLLYVELEPAIQITFLDAAGVTHTNGSMADDLTPPYADAESVRRGAIVAQQQHADEGMRYLRTLARYSREGWPGIETMVAELDGQSPS